MSSSLKSFLIIALFFPLKTVTVMNITDIDEKIMKKSEETGASYQEIGNTYTTSFLDDLQALQVDPPFIVRVSEHISLIIDFIRELEKKGYAYISDQTSDVNFDSQNVENFGKGSETITDKSFGKKSPKDFTLWRHSEREPLWTYESSCNGQKISGRPGMSTLL